MLTPQEVSTHAFTKAVMGGYNMATLLTAQKMADSIVREAEAKRDQILAQAESGAKDRVAQMQQELTEAEERLRQGQLELAKFIASSREICSRELQYLEQLPKLPVETAEPSPAESTPVAEIEENVLAVFAAQSTEEPPAAEKAEPAEETAPVDDYPEGDPFAEETPLDATRRINLDDLKFGRNYSGGSD